MPDWTQQNKNADIIKEFEGIRLNDQRLRERAKRMISDLAGAPSVPLSEALTEGRDLKAAYRFLDNTKVLVEELQFVHRLRTLERMKGLRQVLLIQDTCLLSYSSHPETEGLGRVGSRKHGQGLIVHNCLALDPAGKIPLGILDQQIWARDKKLTKKKDRKYEKRLPEQKESYKWIRTVRSAQQLFSSNEKIEVIHVADREADITELLNETLEAQCKFLIRSKVNRQLNSADGSESKLWETLQSLPVSGFYEMKRPHQSSTRKRARQEARVAKLEIRFSKVDLDSNKLQPRPEGSEITAIYVKEVASKRQKGKGKLDVKNPIEWYLITDLKVQNIHQAIEKVTWYALRWSIESLHKVMKSCCKIEKTQLAHADRLKRLISIKTIIAWYLYWLHRTPRFIDENVSCEEFLTAAQWKVLYCRKFKTQKYPKKPPSAYEAIRWISQLGGFLARKSDGEPGVITFHRGWEKLMLITEAWELFNLTH